MWCGAGGYVFGSASMYANFFGAFLQAAPAGTAILSLACAANHRARHEVARDGAPYIYIHVYTHIYTRIHIHTPAASSAAAMPRASQVPPCAGSDRTEWQGAVERRRCRRMGPQGADGCHFCARTGLTPPHLRRDWARPCPHLHRD